MTTTGAVILAGGAGRRLGGVDKPSLVVAGRPLLDTAVAACSGCAEIVVVGTPRPVQAEVRWTIEEPPGSGPLAALAAGLSALRLPVSEVTVLAADLPSVTTDVVARLAAALSGSEADAVLLTDADGRLQPLTAVYRRGPLADALRAVGDPNGKPLRRLLSHLRIATLADGIAGQDIDTPADLARWCLDSRDRKEDE
ncbi:molybdenum cofactor guanylyltransferase [Phytoactinopolyspora halotolerans]|uniref:molybdenum cofactor guanylyltransferase n=1 Tax=Phytoactinopolyspora halotolerans TaxID=1981512 RepID=UPI001C20B9DC|nr:NTP transferase domain-containing protein [Phytoactinopolyspora halotolerans]